MTLQDQAGEPRRRAERDRIERRVARDTGALAKGGLEQLRSRFRLFGVAAEVASATMGALLVRRAKMRTAGPLIIERSITIGRPAAELYQLLRNPETLPRVMGHIAEIRQEMDGRTHWTVQGPFDRKFEWDARIIEDRPSELLHWESDAGGGMHSALTVGFRAAPNDWGTEVSLTLRLAADGSPLGFVMKPLGPISGALVSKALHRFKSLAETGEVPSLSRQPAARDGGRDVRGGRS